MIAIFRLAPADLWLALQASKTLLEARLRLRLSGLDNLQSWSTRRGAQRIPKERLMLAFRRAVNRLGGTCLVRALALQRLLSRSGIASQLNVGVCGGNESFEAHAWLECDGEVLTGAVPDLAQFNPIMRWPSEGQ